MLLMFRFCKFLSLLTVTALGVGILGVPTLVRADFQLSWNVNTNMIASDPTNTALGFSTGNVGGYSVSGSAAGANSGAFSNGTTGMDLSTISIKYSGSGPSTLVLYLTQNDLTSPLGQGILSGSLTGQFVNGANGTATMVSYGNDTNALYGNATGQAGTSPYLNPPDNVATASMGLNGSASTAFFSTNDFSMTEIITINFAAGGSVLLSSDGDTTFALPAPTSLVLLLAGAPFLVGFVWLRRRTGSRAVCPEC